MNNVQFILQAAAVELNCINANNTDLFNTALLIEVDKIMETLSKTQFSLAVDQTAALLDQMKLGLINDQPSILKCLFFFLNGR